MQKLRFLRSSAYLAFTEIGHFCWSRKSLISLIHLRLHWPGVQQNRYPWKGDVVLPQKWKNVREDLFFKFETYQVFTARIAEPISQIIWSLPLMRELWQAHVKRDFLKVWFSCQLAVRKRFRYRQWTDGTGLWRSCGLKMTWPFNWSHEAVFVLYTHVYLPKA